MKLKRRGFLGSILGFAAFEKACMAEAGVRSPIDLVPNVQYYLISSVFDGAVGVSHDRELLERLSWYWTFDEIVEENMSEETDGYHYWSPYWVKEGNRGNSAVIAKERGAIIVRSFPQCFAESDSAIHSLGRRRSGNFESSTTVRPPVDEIKRLCEAIDRPADYRVSPLGRTYERTSLVLILPHDEHVRRWDLGD